MFRSNASLATVVVSRFQKKIQNMALDRTTKGVLLGFASFTVFSFSDACVRLIRGELPPYESAFFGAVFGLTILPFLLRRGDQWIDILSTTNLPLWLVRFLAYPMGVIGSVTAFTHLSMVVGIVLIVASGILTLVRENVRGTPLPPSVGGERHVAAALVPEAGRGNHAGRV
jgi:hypothetical protein